MNLSSGDVIRVKKSHKAKLLPALVVGHDCPESSSDSVRIQFFHPPYTVTTLKIGNIRDWRPLEKNNKAPAWIRQAFHLAEKYLDNRQLFQFPGIYNSREIVDHDCEPPQNISPQCDSDTPSASTNRRSGTESSSLQIDALREHVDDIATNDAQRQMHSEIPQACDVFPSDTEPCRPTQMKATLEASSSMPSAVTSKETKPAWRSLSCTPAPQMLSTDSRAANDTTVPMKLGPQNCLLEARRSGLDPSAFAAHVSPLYRILFVDCSPPIDLQKTHQTMNFSLPEGIYGDRIRKKSAQVMITPIAESTVYPFQWPKPREFCLDIDGSTIAHSIIPAEWGVKSRLGGFESLSPASFMYLLLDVSNFVKRQQTVLTYRKKQVPSQGRAKSVGPSFRFALFVVEYCEIPRFLAKIETLLEKRFWYDSSAVSMSSEECDVVVEKNVVMSLRCPISMRSIRVPVRGSNCTHAQVIDLSSFVSHIHQSKQWRCPLCSSEIQCLWDIIIDQGVHALVEELKNSGTTCSKATLSANGTATSIESQLCSDRNSEASFKDEILSDRSVSGELDLNEEPQQRLSSEYRQGDHRNKPIEIE